MLVLPQQELDYRAGDIALHGVVLAPADGASSLRPGVLVFHDAMGIGTHTLDSAAKLAQLGFAVFVADLYGFRIPPTDTVRAMQLMTPLRADSRLWRARAQAALDVLAALPGVDPVRLGAVGHCFGGATALELVRHGAPLRAAVCFHGTLATAQRASRGTSRCSVLVCTGADDPLVPPNEIVDLLDEMRQADIDCQTIIYSGARHAFTMPGADSLNRPAMAYHPEAARRAWAAMEAHLAEAFQFATQV